MPKAMSRPRFPALTTGAKLTTPSPIRMMDPFPYWRSIWEIASSRSLRLSSLHMTQPS
uniref:Uncharacterized protein n=1 Tax=uncultured delta proteobacterium HF0200_14D13 TaxID=710830 RepID=E0XXU7_9DELT|nr:hypothetical protein [uncultured delta proteobacterium HF0200_14D13]